ncbi:MAG: fumarylacetoacetate hydrolase family protein [Lachnospiraceae bacterium]|nr:fumarylacetoacetate hydrolase family protein [Lachnospiraceae bacterium]
MRLYTFKRTAESPEEIGIGSETDKKMIYPISQYGMNYHDMNDLIINGTDEDIEYLKKVSKEQGMGVAISDIKLCAPIPEPRQDIICLGINYKDHEEESVKYDKGAFKRTEGYPIYFAKRVNYALATGDVIPAYENMVESLDYEAEMALIIGKTGKNIKKEDVFDHIFGYTIMNDTSARDVQLRYKQWFYGKSMDGFAPMGPCIVTKDEFDNPPVVKIKCFVNGEMRQSSSTDLLIFGIEHAVTELSAGMTLKAGSIISMGTPAGVGMGMTPPVYLKKGDVVRCEVEGIGILENRIG